MTTVKIKTVSGKPLKPVPLWAYPLGVLGCYALFAFPEDSAPDWMERFIVYWDRLWDVPLPETVTQRSVR